MAVSNIVKQLWNRLMDRKVGFEHVLKKVKFIYSGLVFSDYLDLGILLRPLFGLISSDWFLP